MYCHVLIICWSNQPCNVLNPSEPADVMLVKLCIHPNQLINIYMCWSNQPLSTVRSLCRSLPSHLCPYLPPAKLLLIFVTNFPFWTHFHFWTNFPFLDKLFQFWHFFRLWTIFIRGRSPVWASSLLCPENWGRSPVWAPLLKLLHPFPLWTLQHRIAKPSAVETWSRPVQIWIIWSERRRLFGNLRGHVKTHM